MRDRVIWPLLILGVIVGFALPLAVRVLYPEHEVLAGILGVVKDLSAGAVIVIALIFGLLDFLEPTPLVRWFHRARSAKKAVGGVVSYFGERLPWPRAVLSILAVSYVTGSAIAGMLSDELTTALPEGPHPGWWLKGVGFVGAALLLVWTESRLKRREDALLEV